ncbi:MAG TPA: DUF305 domain-containing protein [Candidatus Paceibacterota bacterium]
MNKNIVTALVIGFVVGGFAWGGMMSWRGEDWGMMGSNAGTSIDRHFIEQMIPHHDDAITMAELALAKATKPEIKALASAIIVAQTKEINDMRGWYNAWFGGDVPVDSAGMMGGGQIHGGMMSGDTDFSSLETSTDFDRDFIREMIPHHQMAVMMASMLIGSTERPEMKKLGNDIIKAQTIEIEQMRARYDEWK